MATLASNYSTAFNNIISAVDTLGNSDKLNGSAYKNIKSYTSSVVTPLSQGMILLADAAKADTKLLPDRYRSDVGEDELSDDTDVLTAEIAALDATISANHTALSGMKADDPNKTATENAITSDQAERDKRQKKLDKITAYDAVSSGFFGDIAGLEANINTGLALLNQGITGFNGTFTIPSKGQLKWAKNINKEFKQYQNYQSAVNKAKKGEKLSEEEAKAVAAYQKKHPGLAIDKKVTEAADKKMSQVKEKEQYESVVKKAKNGEELTDKDVEFLAEYSEKHPKTKLDAKTQAALNKYLGIDQSKDAVDGLSKTGSIYDYFNIYKTIVVEAAAGSEKAGTLTKALKANDFKKFMSVSKDVMDNSDWLTSFRKVSEPMFGKGLSIDDVKSGWNAVKTGTKPKGLTVKNAGKSLGFLGGAAAFLDGASTYMERKDKYGETSAAIDGAAHTGTAVGAMYAGSVIGSAIPIPVVGTVAGAAAGYLVGGVANTLYDGLAHGDWDLDNFKLW